MKRVWNTLEKEFHLQWAISDNFITFLNPFNYLTYCNAILNISLSHRTPEIYIVAIMTNKV
jgi:hypothetical protein